MRFFIYGANVSFSLSPAMHNAAYEACGMRHSYRTHSASTLEDFVALVREPDFGGAAIVQPFKTKTLPMMDLLSPQAKAIGALNTVIPLRDDSVIKDVTNDIGIFRERNRTGPVKALYGDNTDWIGIRACVRRGLSPANTVRPQSTGLVCGAGGMARAAIYALISLGVQNIFVCNRTKGNAEELAEHYNRLIKANAIAELSPADAANTTVSALESFKSPWPKNMRHPAMIVSCIPTQTTDGTPTNFTLPQDWLSSRTGGVVVEVSSNAVYSLSKLTDNFTARIHANRHAAGPSGPERESQGLDIDGRSRHAARAGLCAIRAVYGSTCTSYADER
jgi:shikimate 5-dehydrogenase